MDQNGYVAVQTPPNDRAKPKASCCENKDMNGSCHNGHHNEMNSHENRDHCHVNGSDKVENLEGGVDEEEERDQDYDAKLAKALANSRARRQLLTALVIGTVISLGELLGGLLIGSLAIIADAIHDGFDALSYAMSIFFLNISLRKGTRQYTYGWMRGEAVGALVSLFWIYVVTALIIAEAISRIQLIVAKDSKYSPVDGLDMLIMGLVGLFVDLLILLVFREKNGEKGVKHDDSTMSHGHSHFGLGQHSHEARESNVNVLAAYMHAISHAIQDAGVLIAALIIWIDESAQLADPITTIVFAVAGLLPTIGVAKSLFRIFMQGVPEAIDYDKVRKTISNIQGIEIVRDLHIWSLSTDIYAVTAVVAVSSSSRDNVSLILLSIKKKLKREHGITHSTIEVAYLSDNILHERIYGELESCYEHIPLSGMSGNHLGKRKIKLKAKDMAGGEDGLLLTNLNHEVDGVIV